MPVKLAPGKSLFMRFLGNIFNILNVFILTLFVFVCFFHADIVKTLGRCFKLYDSKKSMLTRCLPYFAVALIIFLRSQTALLRSEFWGEDMTEIFASAYQLGIKSVIAPVFGYQMLIPRITGYLSTFLPVVSAPYIYAWVSFVLNVITFSYFSRGSFSHIMPSKAGRALTCILLAVAPGTAEAFCNLCNLTTISTILVLLLLLEKPFKLNLFKLAAFFFLIFSAGQLFLFIPLVLYLWYSAKDNKYLFVLGLIVTATAINILGVTSPSSKAFGFGIMNYKNILSAPVVFFDNFIFRLFYMPFMGKRLTEYIIRFDVFYWPLTMTILGLITYAISKFKLLKQKWFWMFVWAYFGSIAAFAVIAVVRNNIVSRFDWQTCWGIRYSLMPAVIVLILWLSILPRKLKPGLYSLLLFLVIIMIPINIFSRWEKDMIKREDLNWPAQAVKIQDALDKKAEGNLKEPVILRISGQPKNWYYEMSIKSPGEAKNEK